MKISIEIEVSSLEEAKDIISSLANDMPHMDIGEEYPISDDTANEIGMCYIADSEVTKEILSPKEQFKEDCQEAGFNVREYRGRNFYQGPAVVCSRDDVQRVMKSTKVNTIYDNMGLDFVVYPG